MTSLLRGKKEWRVTPCPQAFGTLPEGSVSVSAHPRSWCNWHGLDAGGQLRMKEREACCHGLSSVSLGDHTEPQAVLLKGKERNETSSSIRVFL